MRTGLLIVLVFIVGMIVGLRVMHQYGHCGSGKPILRGSDFFERYAKSNQQQARDSAIA